VDFSAPVWGLIATLLWVGMALIGGWHALLHKKRPQAKLLWLVVLAGIPVLGAIAYLVVGIDRIGRRATIKQLRNRAVRAELLPLLTNEVAWSEHPREWEELPEHLQDFATLLANLSRYRAVPGNRVTVIRGGDQLYPRILGAIDAARTSVVLETFIFDCDAVGLKVLAALSRAARRGVKCHLLYDAIGSLHMDLLALAEAESAGVRVSPFASRNWLRGRFQVNLRNHRKILVIDGELGFTGGLNITSEHATRRDEGLRIVDYHFEVRGPVVLQLTAAFAEDWHYATGARLIDPLYYPTCAPAGDAVCRVLPSGPDGDAEVWHRTLVAAIHNATGAVHMATPYFIPTEAVTTALVTAALRGVRVELVVPLKSDHRFVDWAMKSFFAELLEVGVVIRRRPAPFLHAKLLVIDGVWACVGSANVDPRSFNLNYELNLGITGVEAVAGIDAAFATEWEASLPLEREVWERRGVVRRAWHEFWALWSPLL
jgi:cardiolipin synthase A/B